MCRTRTKPDGTKDFFQERFDAKSGKFFPGMKDGANQTRRVLYHLPDVLRAETVFCVEGEKDADRLMSAGLVAPTCNPGGAGKWFPSYSESLKGKNVRILPDNDEPGGESRSRGRHVGLAIGEVGQGSSAPRPSAEGQRFNFLDSRSKEELLRTR